MITGESIPVEKKAGDFVIGATINKFGAFKFRASKVGRIPSFPGLSGWWKMRRL